MANTAANVLAVASGKIYGAVTGTALPTAEIQGLAAAFTSGDLGYISDSGVTQTINRDTTSIKAWGGDEVRVISTSHELSFKFEMLETNSNTLEAYYGDQTAPGTVTQMTAARGLRQAWVIDIVDGTNLIRIAIPDGEVIELDDITYSTEDAIKYGVTLRCYADGSNVKAYKYVHTTGAS